jgi:3-isopropylmalate/(R)-2-methylmalate dehydratase large subunit
MNTVEKILSRVSKKKEVKPGDLIEASPDLIVTYDYPGLTDKISQFLEENRIPIPEKEKIVIFIDHMTPPINPKEALFHRRTREWADRNGLRLIENRGIGHQVSAELGLARPGSFVVHPDTHVHVLGAFGSLCLTLSTDLVSAFALGSVWIKVPETCRIRLSGSLRDGVTSRDLWYTVLKDLGAGGAVNKAVLLDGEGARRISIDGRMSLCGFPSQIGAMAALFEPDSVVLDYYRDRSLPSVDKNLVERFKSDADAGFGTTFEYDLSEIEPCVVCPPAIDNAKSLSDAKGVKIDQGYIGSCGSGRLEDLEIAARILQGKKVSDHFRLYIVPSSREIMTRALEKGWIKTFVEAGAFVTSSTCDFCSGRLQSLAPGEKAVSTAWLNVPGRMVCTEAEIYLASSATVAATAVAGEIVDPRKYL